MTQGNNDGTTGMIQQALAQAAPAAQTRKTKVAILGFTDSWRLAPFDDPDWEVWGLNELYMFIPRWDRWFEIHRREIFEADKKRNPVHIDRLRAMTCPIYMQQHWDDIPNSVPYPLQHALGMFGGYFTNSISYMLALGIMEGFTELGVFGVDMAHDTEYNSQRPSCEYFIGYALGMGLKVTVPMQSDLLKAPYLYGYHDEQQTAIAMKLKAREQELHQKLQQAQQQAQQAHEAVQQYIGALQDVQHIRKIWAPFPGDVVLPPASGNGRQ